MDTQLILSLITAMFIGGASGYLGSLMLSKRMALVAGPLGHLSLPGIALAIVYGFNISLGAFPFIMLGIFFIWLLELRTKLSMEALTAVVFASGVAIAFLFLPIDQAEVALIGDISKTSFLEMIISIFFAVILLFVVKIIYPKMILINISDDLATAEGVNVKKCNFIYLVLIGVIVSLGVKMVGGLLTAALVSIPAATARSISRNLSQYAYGSLIIGILSACFGILLSKLMQLPAGPLIIIVSTVFFLFSLIFKG